MGKRRFTLSKEEIKGLQDAEAQTQHARELKRLQAIRLYGMGKASRDIQEMVGCSERAIRKWSSQYQQTGIGGVRTKGRGNERAAKLNRAQRAELKVRLQQYRPHEVLPVNAEQSVGQYWGVVTLEAALALWYGVGYSSLTAYRTLLRAECTKAGDRVSFASRRGDSRRVQSGVEKTLTTFLTNCPHTVILAVDEMRLCSQASVMRVWAPVGQTPVIPLDPQRTWGVFYGALDLRTGRQIASQAPTTNREMTANFLYQLLLLFPDVPLILLWDRASWHSGGEVQQVIEQNPRLHLIFFPTACPDLNPQEHLWKAARQQISHNHHSVHFPIVCEQVLDFLNETPFSSSFLDTYLAA